ncbi:MAG TPA: hypothetical protein VGG91_11640 [Myxococcaceae bacterium]
MKRRMLGSILAVGVALLLGSPARAADKSNQPKISDAFRAKLAQLVGARDKLERLGVRPRFSRTRPNAGATRSAMRAASSAAVASGRKASDGIVSIPHFDFTATSGGQDFPLIFVGGTPQSRGKTTTVPTRIIPVSVTLPVAVVDSSGNLVFNGQEITLDGTSKVPLTVASPIFQPATFAVLPGAGQTQWGDAMQRVTFWNSLLPDPGGWHVMLGRPRIDATVVTGDFFDGFSVDFQDGSPNLNFIAGEFIDGIIASYLGSQDIDPGEVPIFATYNLLLFYGGDTNNCCVLGYHDALVTGTTKKGDVIAQTFIFEDFNDPGIFTSDNVADVHAISHEVAEWLNDPFINNVVPPYANGEGTGCDTIMETGDQLVGHSVPVALNGFIYHPQTQDILQWFIREVPSSALGGLYIFPNDPTVTNAPAPPCTP